MGTRVRWFQDQILQALVGHSKDLDTKPMKVWSEEGSGPTQVLFCVLVLDQPGSCLLCCAPP